MSSAAELVTATTRRRLFCTDGVRGVANLEPMTPETALRLGRADLTPPSDGTPIPLDAPLHPSYREGGTP